MTLSSNRHSLTVWALLAIFPMTAVAGEPKSNFDDVFGVFRKAGGTFNGYRLPDGRDYTRFFNFPKTVDDATLKSVPTPNFAFGILLAETGITDAGLKEMVRFKTMDELDVSKTRVTDAGMKDVAKMTALRVLALTDTKVSDAGLGELQSLTALEALYLDNTSVKGPGLKSLAPMKRLAYVGLSADMVTDALLADLETLGLIQFASFTNASRLPNRARKPEDAGIITLGGSRVTDAGLKRLACFKNMARLYPNQTGVTDEGLKHLAGFGSLSGLNLYGTPITDAGLKTLAGLKSLESLDLRNTKVTDAGVAEFKKQLPKCRVSR